MKNFALKLLISIFLLIIILIYGNYRDFESIQLFYILLSSILYVIVVLLRSYKIRTVLATYCNISYSEMVSITAASQFMGAFIPGRAGELSLSAYIKLKYQIDITKMLPTLFVDKLLELFIVCGYFLISSIFISDVIPTNITEPLTNVNIIWIVLIILFLLVLFVFMIQRFKFQRIHLFLSNIKLGLLIPLKIPKIGFIFLVVSGIAVLLEYNCLYLVFLAFKIAIPFSKIVIIHSFGMIIGVISLIPGGHGSTEISMISILAIWGYSTVEVVQPILFSKIITYTVLFMLGISVLPQIKSLIMKIRGGNKVDQI